MWICAKCREEVEDDFDVCWSCGTSRDGVENTGFDPETEGVLDERGYRAEQEARLGEKFVTIASFGNAPEAHMVRSRLEAEGISAFILNELATSTWGFPIDGVHLQVFEKDVARARAVLAEMPRVASKSEEDMEKDGVEEDEDTDDEHTEHGEPDDRIQEA